MREWIIFPLQESVCAKFLSSTLIVSGCRLDKKLSGKKKKKKKKKQIKTFFSNYMELVRVRIPSVCFRG